MHKGWPFIGLLFFLGCARLVPLEVVPPSDITVESTRDRVARGKYLTNNVVHCIYCHSELDWNYYAGGMLQPGTEGSGGERIAEDMGLVGGFDIYTPNITPAAIGDWTDGELIRATVEGINRDGDPLFPVMPYDRLYQIDPEDKRHENTVMPWPAFAGMTEEDLGAIYDYLQTVKPLNNRVEKYPQE